NPGVLVLSNSAGAARQLDAALLVTPHDPDTVARAIRCGLSMSLEERRERWDSMMAVLRRYDVHDWVNGFIAALTGTSRRPKVTSKKTVSPYASPSILPNPFGIAAAKSS